MQSRGGTRRVRAPVPPHAAEDPDEFGRPAGRSVSPVVNTSGLGAPHDVASRCSLRWLCIALVLSLLMLHGLLTLQRIGKETDAIQLELRDTERFIGSIAKHKQLTVNVDPVPTIIANEEDPAQKSPPPHAKKASVPTPAGKPAAAGAVKAKAQAHAHPATMIAPSDPPEETFDADAAAWVNAGGDHNGPAGGPGAPPTRDPKAPVMEHYAPLTKPPKGFSAQGASSSAGSNKTGGLPTVAAPTEPAHIRAARERAAAQARARQTGGRMVRTKQPPPPTDVIGRAGEITEKTIANMRMEARKADDMRAQPWLTDRPRKEDGSPKYRIAIVTLNAKNVQRGRGGQMNKRPDWMHGHSYHNKNEYCKRWGYDFIVEDNNIVDRSRDVAWSKIPIFRKWLPHYDYIMWMDMDAFFMRYEIPLESIVTRDDTKDIVIAKDFHGINFGVFLIRNSPWAFHLLDRMWNSPRQWWKPWEEQSALMALTNPRKNPSHAEKLLQHIRFPRQREINAYGAEFAYGNLQALYRAGDRIVHFPNCKAIRTCRNTIESFYKQMLADNGIEDMDANEVPASQYPETRAPAPPK
uniref:Nucleotide-diphospho-sugar transferase domain-containing protein n=1 Tax=Neobodo designis TaxID=312471 RepID=A0A7S1KZ03_NEODS|mmetsp:Transcript_11680/g.36276  ORF Transcript_11680/g.36276 Transcript_11680/m.36276 type:complete len:579 (+) Transcript_11680:52-1788(+)